MTQPVHSDTVLSHHSKAAFHGAMVGVAVAELLTSKGSLRRLLAGCMAAFHVYAVHCHVTEGRDGFKK